MSSSAKFTTEDMTFEIGSRNLLIAFQIFLIMAFGIITVFIKVINEDWLILFIPEHTQLPKPNKSRLFLILCQDMQHGPAS